MSRDAAVRLLFLLTIALLLWGHFEAGMFAGGAMFLLVLTGPTDEERDARRRRGWRLR